MKDTIQIREEAAQKAWDNRCTNRQFNGSDSTAKSFYFSGFYDAWMECEEQRRMECTACRGKGAVEAYEPFTGVEIKLVCQACKGKGKLV